MPQRHVLDAGLEVAPQDAGETAQPLGGDRVALVGHGRRALLTRPEALLRLADLGALEVAQLEADLLDRGPDGGARPEVLGVAVAGHDLRGRHRGEAERAGHVALDGGIDVGVRPHGAGQLGHGHRVARRSQAGPVAVGLEAPQRHLHPEGGRLGVHAVRAPHGDRVAVVEGDALEDGDEVRRRRDQEIGGVAQGPAQRRVHHVRRREAVVDPPAGLADALLDDVDEGGDVVVGDPLALVDGGHEVVVDDEGGGPAGGGVGRGHHAEGRPRLGGEELDLEPAPEAGGVGEDGRHLRQLVARDHRGDSRGHGDVASGGAGPATTAGPRPRRRHGGQRPRRGRHRSRRAPGRRRSRGRRPGPSATPAQ